MIEIVKSSKDFYVGFTDPLCYVGHCIHCNTMITVSMDGKTNATIEHIMPICAGGSVTDLRNLALACKSCNNKKGVHHDAKNLNQRAFEVISSLFEKRKSSMINVEHETGKLNI